MRFEPSDQFLARQLGKEAPSWLIEDLLPDDGIAVWQGRPRSMKSLTALELALALTTGTAALGRFKVPAATGVLWLTEEDAERIVAHRLRLMLAGRGIEHAPPLLRVLCRAGWNLEQPRDQDAILSAIRDCPEARALVIDPARGSMPSIDKGPADAAAAVRFLRRVQRETPIRAFLIPHVEDADVRDFIAWGFWTGMRAGEIRQLTWAMFDRETWTLRLHASAAKTAKGRVLVLAGPLRAIVERRLAARRLDCPLIFHRFSKGLPGQPVKDFRRAWAKACRAVGLPAGRKHGFTFHDTRRTAIRNLIRAGVDQAVAMKISGHTTTSTFRRYNITSEEDLRAAVEKVAAYVGKLPAERKVVAMSGERK
jgi:integrase